ncbi:WD repeat-containing protein 3-like [Dreissena polymorpha]|uniref:Small-subunit processome Utp12 domain-containing protein n=1 Tax=Dreissena polymorpha TaxID=45954 RepID=A0A9D4HP22_DREPO|nr:WD repeat-containing protein 3-like [Dreissena polymorpha]XP_052243146.1 WD repeat-containing protein 3-like [Dreissena polymorpha]KAH3725680.1 hypothetical protein DPMN_051529 [Dreissena polymorpha]
MGLTKQYLRYTADEVFGLVGTGKSNIVYIGAIPGKYCAVGACENVIIWDLRTGEKHLTLKGEKHEVTELAASPDNQHVAVGYSDGRICVFNLQSGEAVITFSGHKSAVSALAYDQTGLRLVSGGKDTDLIVWDIVNECGLYRLKGHKGLITEAAFFKHKNILVSSSKDTFVKFWDLDTQHCFKTLVEHRAEVYGFVLLRDDTRLVTGSADSELRVWDILDSAHQESPTKKPRLEVNPEGEEEELGPLHCVKVGSVFRSGRDRLVSMDTDKEQKALICHGSDRILEVFTLTSEGDLKKRLAKRQKKQRKKDGLPADSEVSVSLKLEDEISKHAAIKMSAKIVAADVVIATGSSVKVVCLFTNNTVGYSTVDLVDKKTTTSGVGVISHCSHQSDVRTLAFSSDNTALLSASSESVKVWNRTSLQCIRTMSCDYALCSLFAPGDRHIILGTKSGKLQVFDIGSGSLLEDIAAHSGSVWSICMAPDKRGLISGGADKQVKFWNFELVADEQNPTASKQLSLAHMRTLQMDEDVLCVRCSPDQRLLAVSLLDNTVKVFFLDTLKFFLSLYGHKLPVLCMDISADSTLLVSGSADRNIKIWGLDFGDCHKSIFAHDDSVTCVQFIAKTHLFFSGGKDNKIKEWDADKFEHIITLEGHHGQVWCLTVSPSGNVLATASHDKSLRFWQKTHEPLILQEEREMEREKEFENTLGQEGEAVVPGETNTDTGLAGKKSVETVKAAERLMEAIDVYKEEKYKWSIYRLEAQSGRKISEPDPHPMMQAFNAQTPEKYVQLVLRKVKSSELEEALLVLPFQYVIELLKLLDEFITAGWDVELNCRCLFFLLRVHHGQITSCSELLTVIDHMRKATPDRLSQLRDRVGFNLAGLQFIQRDIELSEDTVFFMDATDRFKEKKKKSQKKAILAIKT